MAANGIPEDEARTDICRAVADRVVQIQAKLRKRLISGTTDHSSILMGDDFDIPLDLKPDGLDWEGSRPLTPWMVRRGSHPKAGPWELEWIELSRADVTRVLCGGENGEFSKNIGHAPRARKRRRPAFDRALEAVKELYPEGVPEQIALPNSTLCGVVGAHLKSKNFPNVSDDTILRAAGRRA
jgi:hypothetical protein